MSYCSLREGEEQCNPRLQEALLIASLRWGPYSLSGVQTTDPHDNEGDDWTDVVCCPVSSHQF
jgi:hypothetical protein